MLPLLQIKQVRKNRDDADKSPLFSNVNAEIAEPEMIALLGVSGQGKSTLLRILASLTRADEGEIAMQGASQHQMDPREWRMKVCYVAQQPVMLGGSIEHNLKTVSLLHRTPYDKKLAERLMGELGLEHLEPGKHAQDLSGGEKQRVSLLRSLMLRPQVLLLDEVTASLDRGSKEKVERALQEWHRKEGTAMIWVTHDLEQAKEVSGTVWFMGEGTLLENSTTNSFFERPATELAQGYIKSPEQKE
ncbi:ABC transporter ATP-binding protein [Paenibacillus vietnamensis]|uniref:ABC transporter ATP-binding protein n=1 Tax=Paenibacillus vietnamensis TaxID=2590547 RepID=UPI001CD15572|nr:ATP-binding cassette domain-containing protein [Paenibacillus vietnamensis]